LEKAGDANSDAIEREIQARIDSITRYVWWQMILVQDRCIHMKFMRVFIIIMPYINVWSTR
jgi:hypothetical protein